MFILNLIQTMQTRTAHGKNRISDDRIGLIGTEQTPTTVLQNFTGEKRPSMLFGEVKLILY